MSTLHKLRLDRARQTAGLITKRLRQRREAVAGVAPELRHPLLYVDLSLTNAAALRILRRVPLPGRRVHPGVQLRRVSVPSQQGNVTVVLYDVPGRSGPTGALLWIHGGGTIFGTPRQGNEWCSRVASELALPVISVDYRLAPEHPFPAGLDDCFDALTWLHGRAPELGVDPGRIAVGGDSAGGGLAAVLAQRALDSDVPVAFQLLLYPMLDDRTVLRELPTVGQFVWTTASNRFGWMSYLGDLPHEYDPRPYIAAARRTSLAGLPPAWIGVGDLDLFHDESVDYASRLRSAGVDCDVLIVPRMYHGADVLRKRAATMSAFTSSMLAALRDAIGDEAR